MDMKTKLTGRASGVSRISLEERLERLQGGLSGDPAYPKAALRSMAEMPVSAYFGSCVEEMERLGELLGLEPEKFQSLCYWQAAFLASSLWEHGGHRAAAEEAVCLLASPPIRFFEERRG